MKLLAVGAFLLLWRCALRLLNRTGLFTWHFLTGFGGLYFLLQWAVGTRLTRAWENGVYALAGAFGRLSHTFVFESSYAILYIPVQGGAVTLPVSSEYAGVAEVIVYLSLLAFYSVYTRRERWLLGVAGCAYIAAAGALRLILMAETVHRFGAGAYYAAQFCVGPVFFCIYSVTLYYWVFTRGQVMRITVGYFPYRADKGE